MTKDRVIHGTGDPVFDAIAASLLGEKKELKDIADLNTDQFLDINEEQMKGLSQEELEIVTKLYEVDIDARTREVQSIVDYVAELLTKATALMSDLDVAKLVEAVTTYQKTYAPEKEEAPQPKTTARHAFKKGDKVTIDTNADGTITRMDGSQRSIHPSKFGAGLPAIYDGDSEFDADKAIIVGKNGEKFIISKNLLKASAMTTTAAQITQTINTNDNLMQPIIWGNLIDTVNANEPVVDEAAVMNTFRTILNSNVTDARTALKANMARIIEMAKHE